MIQGVKLVPLSPKKDPRGTLVEVFRRKWAPNFEPYQVNVMTTIGGSMRGSHIHLEHEDWLYIAAGRAYLGIHDCRRKSAAFGSSALLELDSDIPTAVRVPPGVIHGVYFPVDGVLVTVESMYYDPQEELKVKWDDPELKIAWPCKVAASTEIDALSFGDLMKRLEPWQKGWP